MRKIVLTKDTGICNRFLSSGSVLEVVEKDLLYHESFSGHSGGGRFSDKYEGTKYEGKLWFVLFEEIAGRYKEYPLTLENK